MGCGCIVALIGLAAPRFALFLMWLFSDRLAIAFNSFLQGFLGFLLLPFTTLMYALCYSPVEGVQGFGWLLVGFGLLLDLSSYFGGGRAQQQRAA
jgi:hypothetical protein